MAVPPEPSGLGASIFSAAQDLYSQLPLPEENKPIALGGAALAAAASFVASTTLPAPDAELCDGTILAGRKLKRAYKATVNGWSASSFHANVDYRGPSIVIARTGGRVFGGYNPRGWCSGDDYMSSNNAFLFARDGGKWFKMRPIGGEAAVFDFARAVRLICTEAARPLVPLHAVTDRVRFLSYAGPSVWVRRSSHRNQRVSRHGERASYQFIQMLAADHTSLPSAHRVASRDRTWRTQKWRLEACARPRASLGVATSAARHPSERQCSADPKSTPR
jgi:hypothetical protein